jgi:hypothetical protein
MIADDSEDVKARKNGRTALVARPKMAWYWSDRCMVPREGGMDSKPHARIPFRWLANEINKLESSAIAALPGGVVRYLTK